MPAPLAARDAAGDDRVPDARTVEVHRELVVAGPLGDGPDLRERKHAPAAAVVRVLEAHQARARVVLVVGPDLVAELRYVENAEVAVDRAAGHAAQSRRRPGFPDVDVRRRIADELVAGTRVQANRD